MLYVLLLGVVDGGTRTINRQHRELERARATFEGGVVERTRELEEKSALLEMALAAEHENTRRDALTGALNHGAIQDVLRDLVSAGDTAGTCAVVMIDVDGLKAANDTYGHRAGDAVLVVVAGALCRAGATVGRYGGDEFVAVLPRTDRASAEEYIDAVRDDLARAALTDPDSGASIPVHASCGAAIYPDEAATVADLIELSDSAMYAAKRPRARSARATRRARGRWATSGRRGWSARWCRC